MASSEFAKLSRVASFHDQVNCYRLQNQTVYVMESEG